MDVNKIICNDALVELKKLSDESIDMCMTSPPYWGLRNYGVEGQLGLEPSFEEYINNLLLIFDEVKRVLKKSGTCWVNLGDTYSGSGSGQKDTGKAVYEQKDFRQSPIKTPLPNKSLCLIPFRFAIGMVERGWLLRNTLIWHKPNCMPSSVKDRFTVDFEYLFFFVKNKKYYFETQYEKSITGKSEKFNSRVRDVKRGYFKSGQYKASEKEIEQYPGGNIITQENRNMRSVWSIPTQPFPEAHFAVFPEKLCVIPIKSGCPEGGLVLDPFVGAGTTAAVVKKLGRNYLGIELNPDYVKIAERRLSKTEFPLKNYV